MTRNTTLSQFQNIAASNAGCKARDVATTVNSEPLLVVLLLLLLLGSHGRFFNVTTQFPLGGTRMKLPLEQVSRTTEAILI